MTQGRLKDGFTLVELLVTITVIVLLLALLAPALDKAMEQAQRVVCATNQRAIHGGATQYAFANKHVYFICRGREVEATFVTATDGPEYSGNSTDHTVDWLKAMSTVGLAQQDPIMAAGGKTGAVTQEPLRPPGKMWYCPSTAYKGFWDAFWRQYWTAYHYYGGIETWRSQLDDGNFEIGVPSRSPVKLNKSSGSWALTSDRTVLFNKTVWDGLNAEYWGGLPNHRRTEGRGPQGNNESFVDGSVAWIDGRDLLNIHSYRHDGNVIGFFYQSDLGDLDLPDAARAETYMDGP